MTWRAALLDAGGVFLVPHASPVAAALGDLAGRVDRESVRDAHYRAVHAVDGAAAEGADPGAGNVYLTAFAEALGATGVDLDRALERLGLLWRRPADELWRQVVPGATSALRRLALLSVRLAVVSNSDGTVQHELARHGICQPGPGPGVCVTAVFDSAVEGIAKPEAAIFHLALAAVEVEPERAVFVGDSEHFDVNGAIAVGLDAVHVDPLGLCRHPDGHRHVADLTGLFDLPELVSAAAAWPGGQS